MEEAVVLSKVSPKLGKRKDHGLALSDDHGRLDQIRFRSKKPLEERERILSYVGHLLASYEEEGFEKTFERKMRERSHLRGGFFVGESVARITRMVMELGDSEPLHDICGLLEAHGIKVGFIEVEPVEDFFSLSVGFGGRGPAVVVNSWQRISIEQQIFCMAYELGYLVLHPEVYKVHEITQPERRKKEAVDFASFFLMPRYVFWRQWCESSGLGLLDRVMKVKRIFNVSYRAVLYRLAFHFYSNRDAVWKIFHTSYLKRYGESLFSEEEQELIQRGGDFFRLLTEPHCFWEPGGLSSLNFNESVHDRVKVKDTEELGVI